MAKKWEAHEKTTLLASYLRIMAATYCIMKAGHLAVMPATYASGHEYKKVYTEVELCTIILYLYINKITS